MTQKRIIKEIANLKSDPLEIGSAGPANENDLLHWVARIDGPPDTPYAQGTFSVAIDLSNNYPHNAPHLTFTTPIFHPNVSAEGEVRLAEMEKDQWCPALTVRTVLISLQAMLSDPNPLADCILNHEAAILYLEDRKRFEETAHEWTASCAVR